MFICFIITVIIFFCCWYIRVSHLVRYKSFWHLIVKKCSTVGFSDFMHWSEWNIKTFTGSPQCSAEPSDFNSFSVFFKKKFFRSGIQFPNVFYNLYCKAIKNNTPVSRLGFCKILYFDNIFSLPVFVCYAIMDFCPANMDWTTFFFKLNIFRL